MSIWQRFTITLIISALLTFFVGAQDETPTPQGNIVTVGSAFVRGGPSNDYIAIGALYEGDTVAPLNISDDGLWILIPYSRGSGWIQRNLVSWETDLSQLTVLSADITPTPRIAIINTPFIPTATPEGNYIDLENAESAYVRAGPGQGYLRLGQLLPGETVEAISRNENTTWIMIPYSNDALPDEFGWVAIELVYWEDYQSLSDLPIINAENLTPTATFTASPTPTITATASSTFTVTPSNTPEPTLTQTLTTTSTPEPTSTQTLTATSEATATDTPSNTPEPSPTETNSPTTTSTPEPTSTQTLTATSEATATDTPSNTPEPSPTETNSPTNTSTPVPTLTSTLTATTVPSETPQATNTEIQAVAIVASDTAVPTATATDSPTEIPPITDIFAVQGTSIAVEATTSALNSESEIIEETGAENSHTVSIPIETIVGLIIFLIVISYIWFYWQGLGAVGRYNDGFVISDCPVCKRGTLHIDARPSRILGIPSVKRTIRCDDCRSILRETGTKRWRYAVDRIENPTLFDRFNGREVNDVDLHRLEKIAPQGASPKTSPEFLEDDLDN